MQLLPRSRWGTWLLAASAWAAAVAAVWAVLPVVPLAEWPDVTDESFVELVSSGPTFVTRKWSSGPDAGRFQAYDARKKQRYATGQAGNTSVVATSRDGAWHLSLATDRLEVRRADGEVVIRLPTAGNRALHPSQLTAAFSPDGHWLVYRDDGESPSLGRLVDVYSQRQVAAFTIADYCAFSADGRFLAYAETVQSWVVLDCSTGAARLRCAACNVQEATLSDAGDRLVLFCGQDRRGGHAVIANDTRRAVVWDTLTGTQLCGVDYRLCAQAPGDCRRLITSDDAQTGSGQEVTVRNTDDGRVIGSASVDYTYAVNGRLASTKDGQIVLSLVPAGPWRPSGSGWPKRRRGSVSGPPRDGGRSSTCPRGGSRRTSRSRAPGRLTSHLQTKGDWWR